MTTSEPTMSTYERRRWAELNAHWNKPPRVLVPAKVRGALERVGEKGHHVAVAAGRGIAGATPERVKDAGGVVLDATLMPLMRAATSLLEYVTELVTELTDPEQVLEYHRGRGHDVHVLEDLRRLDLKDLDDYTRRMALKWRGIGAGEGAVLGFLATVPVVGTGVSITLDVALGHVLSSAIATRVAYSYGFDATDPGQQHIIERMVRRSYKDQTPKVGGVREAAKAYKAGRGRRNWSTKLRKDEKLLAAVEKLMQQFDNAPVPVGRVVGKMPGIAVITAAGFNQHMLADVTTQARAYAATQHLAEKYDLPLPDKLHRILVEGSDEPDEDDDLVEPL